jgi:hypothetical protein
MKDIRHKIYPVAIGIALFGVLLLLLSRFSIQVEVEPSPSPSSVLKSTPVPSPTITPSRSPSPTPQMSPARSPVPIAPSAIPSPESKTFRGGLRVSNQTDHPLRVALLYQLPRSASASPAASSTRYGEPVHWDFAPSEGNIKGLILSLPDGNLVLREGDVLVAFAQDGSRRYWGPYIVGKTPLPQWNSKSNEWYLILQP